MNFNDIIKIDSIVASIIAVCLVTVSIKLFSIVKKKIAAAQRMIDSLFVITDEDQFRFYLHTEGVKLLLSAYKIIPLVFFSFAALGYISITVTLHHGTTTNSAILGMFGFAILGTFSLIYYFHLASKFAELLSSFDALERNAVIGES